MSAGGSTWQVIAGSPTPEELAAVVLVLGRAGSAPGGPVSDQPRIGGWSSHVRGLRPVMRPGPGAWKASARW